MKNANKPTNPTNSIDTVISHNELTAGGIYLPSNGLTKREMFAMHAMHGLISVNAVYNGRTDARDLLAKDAIAHADALLAELEK